MWHLFYIIQVIRCTVAQQAIAIQAVSIHSQIQVIDQLEGGGQGRGVVCPCKGDLEGTPSGGHTVLVTATSCCHRALVNHLYKWKQSTSERGGQRRGGGQGGGLVCPCKGDFEGALSGEHTVLVTAAGCCHGTLVNNLYK